MFQKLKCRANFVNCNVIRLHDIIRKISRLPYDVIPLLIYAVISTKARNFDDPMIQVEQARQVPQGKWDLKETPEQRDRQEHRA